MKTTVIFYEKNGKKTFYTYGKTFYDIIKEVCGITQTDEDGNELSKEDWMVFGNDGTIILKGYDSICRSYGILDLGGERYIVEDISSCNEKEMDLVVNEFLDNTFDLSTDYKFVTFFNERNFLNKPLYLNKENRKFLIKLLYEEFCFSNGNGQVEISQYKYYKKYFLIRDFLNIGFETYKRGDDGFKKMAEMLDFYGNDFIPKKIYKIGNTVICFDDDNVVLF